MLKCALIHVPKLFKNEAQETVSSLNYCASGLFSLGSELIKEGFETEIIHLGIEKYLDKNFSLSDYIEKNNIGFAAFSLNWHHQTYDTIEIIRNIKNKNNKIHISIGGMTASYFSKEILTEYDFIDSIIKGEGEFSIRMLAKKINENSSDYKDIPNICYIKNNNYFENEISHVPSTEDLKSFNFFNPNIMKHYREYLGIPYILNYSNKTPLSIKDAKPLIALGRGCLGNCLWCGGGYQASKKISKRSFISYRNSKSIIDEIKTLKEIYGIKNFSFSFDPNNKNREPIINILNSIKNDIKEKIGAYYNLDGLADEKFLAAFKNTFDDNSILAFSPIFGNETLRRKYKSFYYSNKELENTLFNMEKMKIKSDIYFSIMPGVSEIENINSKKYGEYLKNKYRYINEILMYPVGIEPSSPLYENPEKYNIFDKKKSFQDFYNESFSVTNSFENLKAF